MVYDAIEPGKPTAMVDSNTAPVLRSTPLGADDARRLVVDIEHLGIDTGHIGVDTAAPSGPAQVGREDGRTFSRPIGRVALWTAIGVAIGLVAALVAIAVLDLRTAPTLMVGIIVGAALGIPALYAGLPLNPEIYDADATGRAVVEVATADLDVDTISKVERLVRSAGS